MVYKGVEMKLTTEKLLDICTRKAIAYERWGTDTKTTGARVDRLKALLNGAVKRFNRERKDG